MYNTNLDLDLVWSILFEIMQRAGRGRAKSRNQSANRRPGRPPFLAIMKPKMNDYAELILERLDKYHVLVVSAPTGYGKSVCVPPLCLQFLLQNNLPGLVACTEPRVVAAVSLVAHFRDIYGVNGDLVGYKVRFEEDGYPATRLWYMTEGKLLHKCLALPPPSQLQDLERKLDANFNFPEYHIVVLDEVHERTKDLDILMAMCKETLRCRPQNFKVVVMSATADVKTFMHYFSSEMVNHIQIGIVADEIGDTVASPFPITVEYRDPSEIESAKRDPGAHASIDVQTKPVVAYSDSESEVEVEAEELDEAEKEDFKAAAREEKIDRLCKFAAKVTASVISEVDGHVLIFMAGEEDITRTLHHLKEEEATKNIPHYPLISHMSSKDQAEAIFGKNEPKRIIVSTNIAESSVTIPGVALVVDSGFAKVTRFDRFEEMDYLERAAITRSSAIQRAGRTGRTCPGRCIRLYKREIFIDPNGPFKMHNTPEILRESLEDLVLITKALKKNLDGIDQGALAASRNDPPPMPAGALTVADLEQRPNLEEEIEEKAPIEEETVFAGPPTVYNLPPAVLLDAPFGNKADVLPLMDMPDHDQIGFAASTLYALDALDARGELTETGLAMALTPLRPTLARAVLEALKTAKCVDEILKIAAMCSVGQILRFPFDRKKRREQIAEWRDYWKADGYDTSDHIVLLAMFQKFHAAAVAGSSDLNQLCNFLHTTLSAMRQATQAYEQMRETVSKSLLALKDAAMPTVGALALRSCMQNTIVGILMKANFLKVARQGSKGYVLARNRFTVGGLEVYCKIHPSSLLFGPKTPKLIMFESCMNHLLHVNSAIEIEMMPESSVSRITVEERAAKTRDPRCKTIRFAPIPKKWLDSDMVNVFQRLLPDYQWQLEWMLHSRKRRKLIRSFKYPKFVAGETKSTLVRFDSVELANNVFEVFKRGVAVEGVTIRSYRHQMENSKGGFGGFEAAEGGPVAAEMSVPGASAACAENSGTSIYYDDPFVAAGYDEGVDEVDEEYEEDYEGDH